MPRRVMEGRVVSDKTNKTVTVLVERRIMDPMYKKFIRRSKKYAAHDEANAFRTGDYVSIEECTPISKLKRWRVISAAPEQAREPKPVIQALAAREAMLAAKPETKKKAKPVKAKPEASEALPAQAGKPKVKKAAEAKPDVAEEPKATAAKAPAKAKDGAAKAKKKDES